MLVKCHGVFDTGPYVIVQSSPLIRARRSPHKQSVPCVDINDSNTCSIQTAHYVITMSTSNMRVLNKCLIWFKMRTLILISWTENNSYRFLFQWDISNVKYYDKQKYLLWCLHIQSVSKAGRIFKDSPYRTLRTRW